MEIGNKPFSSNSGKAGWDLENFGTRELTDPEKTLDEHGHPGYRDSQGYDNEILDELYQRLVESEHVYSEEFMTVKRAKTDHQIAPEGRRQLREIYKEAREEISQQGSPVLPDWSEE